MYRKVKRVELHPRIDIDIVATITLMILYGMMKLSQVVLAFLRGGDEYVGLSNIVFKNESIVFIDRGRRDLDHHGEGNEETSTSKVAKKLGITDNKTIQVLIGLVRRADLQGQSLPFDASDIIKSLQRRDDLEDRDRLEIGVRAIKAGIRFREQEIERDNSWGKAVITEFLSGKEVPPKFEQYLGRLKNPRFERPFDLVEIMGGEKLQHDKETAEEFAKYLLDYIYQDTMMYLEAQDEVKKAKRISVNEKLIIAGITNNPKFNVAARSARAIIIVQKSPTGIQIFFDTKRVDDKLTDSLVSMLRLEECLIQKRKVPETDLRKAGKIEGIPEWHYEKFPQIGKKPAGRLILNGSLTAPDVPKTHIPWETIIYITVSAAKFHPRFNWAKWKEEGIHYHQRAKGK